LGTPFKSLSYVFTRAEKSGLGNILVKNPQVFRVGAVYASDYLRYLLHLSFATVPN